VLDALVAEARLRWGLDLADGLQVLASESLVRSPLEPARPVLIVPASVLRIDPAATPVSASTGNAFSPQRAKMRV